MVTLEFPEIEVDQQRSARVDEDPLRPKNCPLTKRTESWSIPISPFFRLFDQSGGRIDP